MRDALDFWCCINHRVNRAKISAAQIFRFFRLAKIHSARQFAHDQNVYAIALPFLRERTRVRQNFRQRHRAQIREQTKFFAQPQQRGTFGTLLFWNRRVAVRQTDGAEQNGIGFFAQRERRVRQRFARGVNARPADGCFGEVELEAKFFFGGAQNLDGFAHDFVADAVARQGCDVECFHQFESRILNCWRGVTRIYD